MMRTAHRRPGTSLMEVLVGFGILGIGVASVISLYPFAALTAGKALADDRAIACALTADGQLREIHKRLVVEVGEASTEPYYPRLDLGSGTGARLSVDDTGPSYPVFIDPIGLANNLQPATVGTVGPATGIPRVSLSVVTGSTNPLFHSLRYCSQMDGLGYDEDGRVPGPANGPGNPDMRELRYNWLWVVQRPTNRDRYNLRMKVVIFNQRIHQYRPSMVETVYPPPPPGPTVTARTFTPGQTFVNNIPATAELRKGSWIMDAGNGTSLRHAEFYRVVSIADNGIIEVHRPIRRPDGGTAAYDANVVVMPGVVDVYERPQLATGFGP